MPQLSDTMHSGKILVWRKNVGDKVSRGDILAEVETDKANLEIEAFGSGTLLAIKVAANSTAQVGEVIAYLGQPGEDISAAESKTTPNAMQATATPTPSNPVTTPQPKQLTPEHIEHSSTRLKISPLARKIAEQNNINLEAVRGSGPQGRIIRKDLELVRPQNPPAQTAPRISASTLTQSQASSAATSNTSGGRLSPLSKMRETIARRMQQSVTEAPHFFTSTSINMREALRLREVLKAEEEFKGVSVNHLIIKAAAYALSKEPRVNCSMKDGQLFEPASINIGIITAVEDGLMIPVIRSTNELSLKDLVFEARAAIERVRAGRPTSSDLIGGTFSISNMGMFDVENFTAIINPGQGAVLAVSAVKDSVVAINEQPQVLPIMKVTISVDHRIIDGVMAANFLKYFKQALEVPALLMV